MPAGPAGHLSRLTERESKSASQQDADTKHGGGN